MNQIEIQTAHNVTIRYEPASIGDRILATILDYLVILAFIIPLSIIVSNMGDDFFYLRLGLGFLTMFIFLFYPLLIEIFMNGQSIGKRQRNIKIIRMDGTEARLGNYLMRWLLRPVDTIMMGVFAILSIAIGGRGQRLGDLAAATTVVRLNPPIQLAEVLAFNQKNEAFYEPTYLQVTLLSDNDINIIKDALRNYQHTRNNKLIQTVADKVKTLLKIESREFPLQFLHRIVKDHSFLTAEKEEEIYGK